MQSVKKNQLELINHESLLKTNMFTNLVTKLFKKKNLGGKFMIFVGSWINDPSKIGGLGLTNNIYFVYFDI